MQLSVYLFMCLLCAAGILPITPATAQVQDEPCGTMEYLKQQKKADPTLEARMHQHEEWLQNKIAERQANHDSFSKTTSVITIPVVVHIVYNAPEENVADQRVYEQIATSNSDFAGLSHHSMGVFSPALKANTNIQFCLAQKKIDGSPTTGIERRYNGGKTRYWFMNDSVKSTSKGGLDAWDPTVYMNIWVCNSLGGLWTAYGQFPGSGINATYGVVVDYLAFGLVDSTGTYGGGSVVSHELGHCLNLRHIWADDNNACTGTDYCSDTPNQAGPTYGINTGLLTDACSPVTPGIMYMNFMDYSGFNIWANFTPNQATRMQTNFAAPSGPLLPLLSSTACSPPSGCETPTALRIMAVTRTTATVGWTAMYNSVGYNIRYKKTTASTWTNTTSTTNSKLLTGLTKNTTYEFQVQNVCSGISPFSASVRFTTPKTGAAKDGEYAESDVPSQFSISPNPATGLSTIYYSLTEAARVSITITNVLGAEVARIDADRAQDPGKYSMQYDAARLIPGVYFVILNSGAAIETKTFVVQR